MGTQQCADMLKALQQSSAVAQPQRGDLSELLRMLGGGK